MNQPISLSLLSKYLKTLLKNNLNFIDVRATILAPHVIYRGIDDPYVKSELHEAFMTIVRDGELSNKDYRYFLLDYLNGDYEISSTLLTYSSNFYNTISYLISPSPDMEEHIFPSYIQKAEERASLLISSFNLNKKY